MLTSSHEDLVIGTVCEREFHSPEIVPWYLTFTPKRLNVHDSFPHPWGKLSIDRPGSYDLYAPEAAIDEVMGPFLNEDVNKSALEHQPELAPRFKAMNFDESNRFPEPARNLQTYSQKNWDNGSLMNSVDKFTDLNEYSKLLNVPLPETDELNSMLLIRGCQKYRVNMSVPSQSCTLTRKGGSDTEFPETIYLEGLEQYVAIHFAEQPKGKLQFSDCMLIRSSIQPSQILYLIGRYIPLLDRDRVIDFCIEAKF